MGSRTQINAQAPRRNSSFKLILIASLSSGLEFYDFIVFVMLTHVISQLFFPTKQPINATLATFTVFMVGYLARPLGGLIFGHFGDLYGRKRMYYFSILLMAFPSMLIAILPTYQTIGLLAPICLLLLRITQGIALGAEIPGMITFTYEHTKTNKRGLYIAFLMMSAALSTLASQAIVASLHGLFTPENFARWGWRIAFLIGGLLAIVSSFLRKNLNETPGFIALEEKLHFKRTPIVILFKAHGLQIIQATSILALMAIGMILFTITLPTYIASFRTAGAIDMAKLGSLNVISILFYAMGIFIFGILSDYIARKKLILTASALLALASCPMFYNLLHATAFYLLPSMLVLTALLALLTGSCCTMLADLFPRRVRYTGIALSYNLGFAAFGSTAPLVTTLLIKYTHQALSPAFYITILAIICFLLTASVKLKNS